MQIMSIVQVLLLLSSMKSKYYPDDSTEKTMYDYRAIVTIQDTLEEKVIKPISLGNLGSKKKTRHQMGEKNQQYYQFQY